MIELIHLQKKYKDATPLRDVNVKINDGDVISIIGGSGVGKSTLLRCINMIDPPTGGQILLDGVDITSPKYDVSLARRKMGMVFQSFNLFGHLTVIENIMLAQIDILKRSKQEAYDKGVELLKLVGLSGRELSYPDELSGGQKQRVAIARTLAMDPSVILFDEPTSALDPSMVHEVQSVIANLAKMGKTMLIVTHEMAFARSVANRVFFMADGGIYEDGTPEQIFENPQKELTQRFICSIKVLTFDVDSPDFNFHSALSKIDSYCANYGVPRFVKYKINLAFEEMTRKILLPILGKTTLHIAISYSGKDKTAEVTITYSGERFDPAKSENDFSYAVLEKIVGKISYEYDEQNGLNTILISA